MRKHNFVVGYKADGECIYGKSDNRNFTEHITPMTVFQAKNYLKTMTSKDPVIFKLVEVKRFNLPGGGTGIR